MTTVFTSTVTEKGQVTIPNRIRKLLHIQSGSAVGFVVTDIGVMIQPYELVPKQPYTKEEWKKIKKLADEKGKIFTDVKEVKKYLTKL